jgi:hypothetical protein
MRKRPAHLVLSAFTIVLTLAYHVLSSESLEHRPDRYNFSLNLTKLNEIFANGADDTMLSEFFSSNNNLFAETGVGEEIGSMRDTQTPEIDFNHIIIFNIGNEDTYEDNQSHSYRLKFDQESINYCNFDPKYLSNKRRSSRAQAPRPQFNMNIFMKGQTFNETSQITGSSFNNHDFFFFKFQSVYMSCDITRRE